MITYKIIVCYFLNIINISKLIENLPENEKKLIEMHGDVFLKKSERR
jgi:hypothetical protein